MSKTSAHHKKIIITALNRSGINQDAVEIILYHVEAAIARAKTEGFCQCADKVLQCWQSAVKVHG